MITMAILKSKAARDLSADELMNKLAEIKLELAKERGKIRVGGVPENPGKIREMRKTTARIVTIQKQKLTQKAKSEAKSKGGNQS